MNRTSSWLILISVVTVLGLAALRASPALAANVRIEQVTVVSPERARPVQNATVVVRDDRIVEIATRRPRRSDPNETVIDGKGLFLTPGLIDSHVHLNEVPGMRSQDEEAHPEIAKAARAQIPRSYLLYGYTTLIDLISTPQRMAVWNAEDIRPDVRYCGATPVIDGYGMMPFLPPDVRYRQHPYMLVQPGDESKLPPDIDPAAHTPEAVVARMKAEGAFCVKAFSEDGFGPASNLPTIRLDFARRLVRAAHDANMLVFIHANAAESQAFALEAGVDIIVHGMWHWGNAPKDSTSVTPEVKKILDEVSRRRVGWQPTIQVLPGERDLMNPAYLANPTLARVMPASLIDWYRSPEGQWFHDILVSGVPPVASAKANGPEAMWTVAQSFYAPFMSNNMTATAYLAKRKGKILFGTDTPSSPTYANLPGLNGFLEMGQLVAAGLTPVEIFRAATVVNAEALGLSGDIGTVQVGKRANLLLMREDPTRSVAAYATIVKVIVGGRVLDASELAANRPRT